MFRSIGFSSGGVRSPLYTDLARRGVGRSSVFSDTVHKVIMLGPNGLHFSGGGDGQNVHAEYTPASTPDDPIVRISGDALGGRYEKVVHLNDVDPANASYPELCALVAHLTKTGAYRPPAAGGLLQAVPLDVPKGDYAAPRDFIAAIEESVSQNQRVGNWSMVKSGAALLTLFRSMPGARPQ